MNAYVVSRVAIRDREAMSRYIAAAGESVAAYGGRYLVRGGDIQALEGEWEHDRMVVLEFPSRDAALAWYESDEYRPLRELRWSSADANILLAGGADPA